MQPLDRYLTNLAKLLPPINAKISFANCRKISVPKSKTKSPSSAAP